MRVLLIEDVPATAQLIAAVLRSVPPVEAVTWRATVPRKVADRFDLVVLELSLQGYTGAGALRALREVAPAVPVLVCTDCREGSVLAEVVELDAAVVAKDVLAEQLGPTIVAAFGSTPSPDERIEDLRRRAAKEVRRRFDASESGCRLVEEKARERITEVRKRLTP